MRRTLRERLLRPGTTWRCAPPGAGVPLTCCDGPYTCAAVRRCSQALSRSYSHCRPRCQTSGWNKHPLATAASRNRRPICRRCPLDETDVKSTEA